MDKIQPISGLKVERVGGEQQRRRRKEQGEQEFGELLKESIAEDEEDKAKEGGEEPDKTLSDRVSISSQGKKSATKLQPTHRAAQIQRKKLPQAQVEWQAGAPAATRSGEPGVRPRLDITIPGDAPAAGADEAAGAGKSEDDASSATDKDNGKGKSPKIDTVV
ncbi:hypothetical protein IIA79_03940 [bacterium]|nr:hypothetical protein [bacterium]